MGERHAALWRPAVTPPNGRSPDQAVGQRLKENPELANPAYRPPEARDVANIKAAAQLAVLSAKDVS